MVIGVIQASSQADKNQLIYDSVTRHAPGCEVINFGCFPEEEPSYSYIEISVMTGLLLAGGAVDFVVTGCSSGQGMMLACNSMPGVICGYAPTPMDAYLFAQINNGNAISLPLGEDYTWAGVENLDKTLEKLFSEPFGGGYPKGEEDRKKRDTLLLKTIRRDSQISITGLLDQLDNEVIGKILGRNNVIDFILNRGSGEVRDWLLEKIRAISGSVLELCIPELQDLWFREKMLGDEDTMSYNAAWGGTVEFPEEDWADWYDWWVEHPEGKRFYRYLRDSSTGEFVGETAYHYDSQRGIYIADVIVFSQYRNRGFGTQGLRMLCSEAAGSGVDILYDDIAIDNPGISIFLKEGFTEEYRTDQIIMLKKDLIKPADEHIRRASVEDSAVLASLAVKLWPDDDVDELEAEFRILTACDDDVCFIKYIGDEAAGFAECSLRNDYVEGTDSSPVGYLEAVYILPQYRKSGYAAELLSMCEEWAREKGCTEFASDCELENVMSLGFHLAVGFEEANRIICFRKDL